MCFILLQLIFKGTEMIVNHSWVKYFSIYKDIKQSDIVRLEDVFSTYIPPAIWISRSLKKPMIIVPRGTLGEWCLGNRRAKLKKLLKYRGSFANHQEQSGNLGGF